MKVDVRKYFLVALLLVVILVIGCVREDKINDVVNDDAIILDGTLSNLQFESSSEGEMMKRFDSVISEFTDSSWKSVGYEEVGNFYEKSWCKGANAPLNCMVSGANAYDKDQQVISLYTLHFDNQPEFFGLGFSAKRIPETGWGVSFSSDENGKSIVGEGLHLNFYYFAENKKPVKSVMLGSGYSYDVYETKISYGTNTGLRDGVQEFISSAESLRDTGLKHLDVMSKKVYDYINSESAVRCEYEPYKGGGIPPRCIEKRKLTDEERQESLVQAQEYYSAQINALNSDYVEMYNVLIKTFPFGIFD